MIRFELLVDPIMIPSESGVLAVVRNHELVQNGVEEGSGEER